jgi:CubicO group peptidase (beta-lactamase class C family)
MTEIDSASALGDIADRVAAGELANLHAVVVLRDGDPIYEQHFGGRDQNVIRLAAGDFEGAILAEYTASSLHDLRSVTKSITSLLYGIALADGLVPGLDTPVYLAFPDHADLRTTERDAILVRHLLTMTVGIEWDESISYEDERNSERQMWIAPDAVRYVLSRPVVDQPGASFVYNGGATQVLAALIQQGTRRRLDECARDVLFAPLGITDVEWARDRNGNPMAASGLRLRAVDLAKIAELYLTDGRVDARRVAPGDWLRESLQPHVPGAANAKYGYQWWISKSGRIAAAMGNGGQRAVVIRGADVVGVVLAGNYDNPTDACSDLIVGRYVLPAAGLPATDEWWTL